MEFKELGVGDWLYCSEDVTTLFKKGNAYQVKEVCREAGIVRSVLIGTNGDKHYRVFPRDYGSSEHDTFRFFAKKDSVLAYLASTSERISGDLEPTDAKPKPKPKLASEFTSPSIRAKALRYEQEYLLDSLRTSDDLEENEKDMLRLKEIGEELEALTAFDTVLEEHVEWK